MKKVLSLVLAGLLTASLAVVAGAQAGNENIGTIPFVVEGAAIDAAKDAAYANAMVTEVAKGFGGDATATATAYAIHNGENLYVYAEIMDADLVDCDPAKQESAPWETDSFEIILTVPTPPPILCIRPVLTGQAGLPTTPTLVPRAALPVTAPLPLLQLLTALLPKSTAVTLSKLL